MKKSVALWVVVAVLMAPAAGLAKDKAKKHAASMEMAGEEQVKSGMMRGMMTMWWNMGAMSHQMGQMLAETGEILGKGDLSPEAQKKLGNLTQEMGRMVSRMFGPVPPGQQQHYLEQLNKLKDRLESLETSVQSSATSR
ncbi:MAG: hypothetical protein P8168_13880 [Deltaproteobacteria bacterium]|jgi:hypothetical protein